MSTINATTHPFYDKHDALIKSIWSVDRSSKNVDEKLAKVKEAIGSSSPSSLFDIYNEKTGESRAKVSPLIIACFEGDYDTIKFLIDHNVDVNLKETEHDLTALHVLVDAPYKGQTVTEKQRAELIRLLISKGADVNHPDKHQICAVHKTVINDRPECLDALIEGKVNPNVVFMGETALSIAARQNRDRIMKKLLDYSATKSDVRNETGGTVLHFASAGMIDSCECVDLLIKAGVAINSQDQRGNTPLMVACFFNKPRILQSLITAKADVSIKNNDGKDAAAICEERDLDECKAVLQNARK